MNWDDYFMSNAIIASLRSKDPNTKVGACLVDKDKHIIGTGYNWFIKNTDDNLFPLNREGDWLNTKYPYIVHAEANCLLNTVVSSLKDSTLYCTLFPCNECAKLIIQSGIKRVVYLNNKHQNDNIYIASNRLFEASNTKIEKLTNENIIKNLISNLEKLV